MGVTMRYALLDDSGLVISVCLWDGAATWAPPAGLRAVAVGDLIVGPGDTLDAEGHVIPATPDVEAVRAAALAEVAALEAERMGLPVTLPGLPPMGIGGESPARWASILLAAAGCVADGIDPDGGVLFPASFAAADGSLVTLPTYAFARQVHRGLLQAGAARTIAADRARSAVTQAATVEEITAALDEYRGTGP